MSDTLITIDGSQGEGGGQILRTSLALSLCLGRPLRVQNIRSGRRKPGLMRQHLAAVRAACEIGGATLRGDEIGSTEILFEPGEIKAGEYDFAVGSAGSATLVLQTVLPALMTARGPSRLVLQGGTHNPFAPPFDYLERVFLPLIRRMGPRVEATLERPGFYPSGGGQFTVTIEPAPVLERLAVLERGATVAREARAMLANIPASVAKRELKVIARRLGWPEESLLLRPCAGSAGPGNVLLLFIESEHAAAMFVGFGQRGVKAEVVAAQAATQARRYIGSSAAVDEHLADQLLLPMALAGGGSFSTVSLTKHTRTNVEVIRQFLPLEVTTEEQEEARRVVVTLG